MAQPRYYFKNKKSVLKNLSENKIKLAIALYQRKESIEQIKIQLDIKSELQQINFYKHLPYERSTDNCYCGDILYQKVASNSNKANNKYICFSCGHYEAPWCTCPECVIRKNKWREEGMIEFTKVLMGIPATPEERENFFRDTK